MEKEFNNLISRAICNCHSNNKLSAITLDATWTNHGPSCSEGSWVETEKDQSDFEMTLCHLDWIKASEFPNGIILTAKLPQAVRGFQSAVDAAAVDPETIVTIGGDEFHPAAIAVGDAVEVQTITMIVELNAMEDSQTAFAEISGPIVATWFPGTSTPKSEIDGVLQSGDVVTVATAMKHGFRTIKFAR